MTNLIHTRRGAILYAVAAPVLALALCLLTSAAASPLPPGFLFLASWMAFGLCAWGLLIRWAVRRMFTRYGAGLATCLLALPLAMLMWFPAGFGGPFLYLWSIICLIKGRYPDIPWSLAQRRRTMAVACAILLLTTVQLIRDTLVHRVPAVSPEEVYHRSVSTTGIIDTLPQEDGSVLVIGLGGCAVAEEASGGWNLREIYPATALVLEDGTRPIHASICRNPSGETDVVTVWKAVFAGDDPSWGLIPPRDSIGSVFRCVTDENHIVTSTYYYTFVDADTEGYTVYAE